MAGEQTNVRGPCSSCGAQLASDQRYCVECGQRVGPPLAMPYTLPAPSAAAPAVAGGRVWRLPIAPEMASLLGVLALGFGVVLGTAISPNLAGIVAAPSPPAVVEAPPEAPPVASGGGGGGSGPLAAAAPAAASVASTTPTESSGGGGGGGDQKKKKKKQKEAPISFSGTVVHSNPVAQSYTVSAGGGLIAIHADALPQVGDQVESPVRKLSNGTYAEDGARSPVGTADVTSFQGTVTYCADLEQPSAPCDGANASDHYVYTVSGLGASILVTWPHSGVTPPPKVGSTVQVGVQIGAAFPPIAPLDPADWRVDPACTPGYDERTGLPAPPVVMPELTQTSMTVSGQATSATLESVVQTRCPVGTPRLILSADDVRESGRDLAPLAVPAGIDPNRLTPGQAVQVAVGVAGEGILSLEGITSDQGAAGADDAAQGQGTLTGS
ncbi:MAG TPA: hypothetical protein VIZ61_12330 [Solirubrobacterales bacterium]